MKPEGHTTDAGVGYVAGQLASRTVEFHEQHGLPIAVIPDGQGGFQIQEYPGWLPHPRRVKAEVSARTPQSFVDYINRFGSPQTVVFATPPRGTTDLGSFRAVIDYHGVGADGLLPRHGGHKVEFRPEATLPWTEWMAKHNTFLDQVAFTQFLEDHIPEIAAPPAAELVEVARHFEAHKSIQFKSAVRERSSSISVQYEETVKETVAPGKAELPSELTLVLPVFEGGDAMPLNARVRFQIGTGGSLTLKYMLIRPDLVLRDAFDRAAEAIAQGLSKDKVALVMTGQVGRSGQDD